MLTPVATPRSIALAPTMHFEPNPFAKGAALAHVELGTWRGPGHGTPGPGAHTLTPALDAFAPSGVADALNAGYSYADAIVAAHVLSDHSRYSATEAVVRTADGHYDVFEVQKLGTPYYAPVAALGGYDRVTVTDATPALVALVSGRWSMGA